MSARDMEPIIITVVDPNVRLEASVSVLMWHEEALKLTAYSVPLGSRCSPCMTLRQTGATLKALDIKA